MRTSRWHLKLVVAAALLAAYGCGDGGPPSVEFRELVSHPDAHNGKTVCPEGTYAGGFEVSALGESTYQRGSAVYLTEPAVWI